MLITFKIEKTKFLGIDLVVYSDGICALQAVTGEERGFARRPNDQEIREFRDEIS